MKDRQICKRCGVVHTQEPVDPEKIAAEMARQIADQIDAEILEELRALGEPKLQSHK